MKQSIICSCLLRADEIDFFIDSDESLFNKLSMQKIVEKFRRPPFKNQLVSQTKKIEGVPQNEFETTVDLSRNKIQGTIILN